MNGASDTSIYQQASKVNALQNEYYPKDSSADVYSRLLINNNIVITKINCSNLAKVIWLHDISPDNDH